MCCNDNLVRKKLYCLVFVFWTFELADLHSMSIFTVIGCLILKLLRELSSMEYVRYIWVVGLWYSVKRYACMSDIVASLYLYFYLSDLQNTWIYL